MPAAYRRTALADRDGIPVFSVENDYIRNYERISADHLAEFAKSGKNPFMKERLWRILEESTVKLVRAYSQPGEKILDVGVGLGRLLSQVPELQRFGMDISSGYLQVARREGIDVCFSLIEDMPYEENSFDVVVCTDVLEHVIDLNTVCGKILSVVRPGGTLIVRVPYREDLETYVRPDFPYALAHVRSFDEFSLRIWFERVWKCRVCELVYVRDRSSPSTLRMRLPWDLQAYLNGAFRWTGKCLPFLTAAVSGILYFPQEINIVVRKDGP